MLVSRSLKTHSLAATAFASGRPRFSGPAPAPAPASDRPDDFVGSVDRSAEGRPTSQNLTPSTLPPGRVLQPGDDGWSEASRGFNARITARGAEPKFIAYPQNAGQVAETLVWARETGTEFRIRCGRHSYEGYSTIEDGLVLDVSDMNRITYDRADGSVSVGAGARVMDVAEHLARENRMLPLPTFPSVGISGATLGGGVGMTSRKWGLTCDNLISAQVVTADGRELTCSKKENPDLFWALQGGGGGNFAVVTEFTFQTHPVENVALVNATWGWDQFNQVVDAWQHWAPNSDPNLTTALALTADGKLSLYGQYTPDSAAGMGGANTALAQLLADAPTADSRIQVMPPIVAARVLGQLAPEAKDWRAELRDEQVFKSTSAVAFEPIPGQAIDLLRVAIENSPRKPGERNQPDMVQLLSGGGASARQGIQDTAVFHRGAKFVLQYDGYWDDPADEGVNTEWVEKMRDSMLPYATGAYVNYHDALLEDPLVAYYGPNLVRLAEVKKAYDPGNVFRFPHSIPPELTDSQKAAAKASVRI
jgi:FAD/FMN-containing dehydrogenase